MLVSKYANFAHKNHTVHIFIVSLVLCSLVVSLGVTLHTEKIEGLLMAVLGLPFLIFFGKVAKFRASFCHD